MLVINGKKVAVPGLDSACYLDNKAYGFTDPKDYGFRGNTRVQSITVHTRMGIWPQPLSTLSVDRHWDTLGVKNASGDDRIASWHISIDADGSFVCHLDLVKHKAYHAGQCNDRSIGIEMYQASDGTVTQATLDSCVKIIDVLTRELGIQRQYCTEYDICQRFADPIPSVVAKKNLDYMDGGMVGKDFVGIFGHRNATRNRGKGDPGEMIFEYLKKAGYEGFSVNRKEDLDAWKGRQLQLGMATPYDGIPGPMTVAALKAKGHKHGLYVKRPGD